MACVSAMQKAIRRGMEREAMEFAVGVDAHVKSLHSMVCNGLEVICQSVVATAVGQAAPAPQAATREAISAK